MIKAIDLLEMSPVIAAIKDDAGLKRCLDTECQVVFILYGNICNIKDIVAKLKAHGKCAMVHADLVQGLGSKEVAIDFIKEQTGADGIISTKPMLVRRAQELKMFGILRAFIIDSMAVANTQKMLDTFRAGHDRDHAGCDTKNHKEPSWHHRYPSDRRRTDLGEERGSGAVCSRS